MIRAYHLSRGDTERVEVIVPDSSHGTNPATASMAGFKTVTIPSDDATGQVDLAALNAALGPRTAAVMLTNPSTLGLFEAQIGEVLEAVHAAGALAYMDGANMNAILGKFKPGQAGFDVMHFNTHKTFSTPHGGGGPGAGPVAVNDKLVPFLPWPRVLRDDDGGAFRLERDEERPSSIGRVRSYQGSVGVLVRAYAYMLAHGGSGLEEVSEDAVLAANYLKHRLADTYDMPFDQVCKHEFVASAEGLRKETGVRMLDIAKRLIDHGYHPPTIYFPLIVEEGMLVEPTETESLETLDAFADALIAIAAEARSDPELVKSAPHAAPVRRLDEATAARHPDLHWRPMTGAEPVCPQ
jgi:glycine dehydrogenase subunit 2